MILKSIYSPLAIHFKTGILFISMLFCSIHPVFSQDLVVDVDYVLSNLKAIERLNQSLNEKKMGLEKELEKKKTQLQSDEKEWHAQSSILSQDAKEKRKNKLISEEQKLKSWVMAQEKAFNEFAQYNLNRIQVELDKEVASIAKEKQAQMVFPANQLLWFDAKNAISPQLIQSLNTKLKDFSVESPKVKK